MSLISALIRVANNLDVQGFVSEADELDQLIQRFASFDDGSETSQALPIFKQMVQVAQQGGLLQSPLAPQAQQLISQASDSADSDTLEQAAATLMQMCMQVFQGRSDLMNQIIDLDTKLVQAINSTSNDSSSQLQTQSPVAGF